MMLAATTISQELKRMAPDDQLPWARKLSDLRAAGLITGDNLEAIVRANAAGIAQTPHHPKCSRLESRKRVASRPALTP